MPQLHLSLRCFLSFLLCATLALSGTPALARAPAAEDMVNLKNGGIIRGKILELIPDESVTIESAATGERRTYPWSDVAGVERGSQADAPPQAEAPPPERPRARGSRIHIETTRDAPVQLFEVTGETIATGYVSGGGTVAMRGITYRSVCRAPCDQPVDGSNGQPFFFGGDGVTGSRRFTLTYYSGDVLATVKPGRPGLRVGGLLAMSFGLVGIATGAVLFPIARSRPSPEYSPDGLPIPGSEPPPNYTPAIALLISGIALFGGGIAMYLLGRTRFKLEPRGLGRRIRLDPAAGLTARF